ncbi:MAG: tetratricopeptide repeat protein [Polyangia bacterium]
MKRTALLVAALLLSSPLAVRAQAEPAAVSQLDALIDQGYSLYSQGRYSEALTSFQAAYRIEQYTQLLQNIAKCHLQLGHKREALEKFELYLRTDPNIKDSVRIETQQIVAKLEAELGVNRLGKEAAPVYKKWWFWTLIGTAAAGAAAGIAVGVVQSQTPPPDPNSVMPYTPKWVPASTQPGLFLQGSW